MFAARQVSLKGARALIKVFTDMQASVEDIQSWFSVGLEPIIGLVRALFMQQTLTNIKDCIAKNSEWCCVV